MGETQHRRVARPRERVERRCFHLDGEDAQRPGARDGRGRFPKRRIGCPARPGKDLQPLALQRVYRDGFRTGYDEGYRDNVRNARNRAPSSGIRVPWPF